MFFSRPAILSISSKKTMPDCSTRSTASRVTSSMSISFCASSCARYFRASGIFMTRSFFFPGINPPSMSRRWFSRSSMPPTLEIIPTGRPRSLISISTVRLSSRPSRNCLRSFCRVLSPDADCPGSSSCPPRDGLGGSNRSSTRSSAMSSAFRSTRFSDELFTRLTDCSVRSRMIDSTSRPTYPTSVNFDASTLMNGASASFASRLEISVLPTPVGPIMTIFFGKISSRNSGLSCWRRHRFRNAMATIRLASRCPITYRSSTSTISRGDKLSSFCVSAGEA